MARTLVLSYEGADLPFQIEKVDRSKLYGFVDVEARDDQDQTCQLVVLADDGQTLIGAGGTAMGMLSPSGHWLDKSTLNPVDVEGNPITPVRSSFSAPVPLTHKATIEEYLSHNIKAVYLLRCDGDASRVAGELKRGTIYQFPFSHRGGLEPDVGFLLAAQDGNLFLAVGQPTSIHFVGFEPIAWVAEVEEETSDEEEPIDFGMM